MAQLVEQSLQLQRSSVRIQSSSKICIERLAPTALKRQKLRKRVRDWPIQIIQLASVTIMQHFIISELSGVRTLLIHLLHFPNVDPRHTVHQVNRLS